MKRTPLKKGNKLLKKRNSIKRISAKGVVKKEEKKELLKKDFSFYEEIWEERKHVCFECDCFLSEPVRNYYFHHLLPKQSYKELRHVKENIALVCLNCHSQTEIDINKTPKIKQKTQELKNESKD